MHYTLRSGEARVRGEGSGEDHYSVLGVPRDGSADEIRRAFRRIARECHPDVAGNDPAAAERFKRVRAAYEVLVDPDARARYDRRHDGYRPRTPRPPPGPGKRDLNLDDLVDGFSVDDFGFGDRKAPGRPPPRPPPPPRDLEVTVDVDVGVALLGGRVAVDSPGGRLMVGIPEGTSSGARLRLRGKGVAGGDLTAVVRIVVPERLEGEARRHAEALVAALEQERRGPGGR